MTSSNTRRHINVEQIYEKLGTLVCNALPGFHTLTGCDYNPAFFHRGKKKPLQKLISCKKLQKALAEFDLIDNDNYTAIFNTLQKFICRVYNTKKSNTVNEARYDIFLKTYDVNNTNQFFQYTIYNFDASNLPPCESEFKQQFLRAVYITKL